MRTPITPPAVLGLDAFDLCESYYPGPGLFSNVIKEFAVVLAPIVIPEFFLVSGCVKY